MVSIGPVCGPAQASIPLPTVSDAKGATLVALKMTGHCKAGTPSPRGPAYPEGASMNTGPVLRWPFTPVGDNPCRPS